MGQLPRSSNAARALNSSSRPCSTNRRSADMTSASSISGALRDAVSIKSVSLNPNGDLRRYSIATEASITNRANRAQRLCAYVLQLSPTQRRYPGRSSGAPLTFRTIQFALIRAQQPLSRSHSSSSYSGGRICATVHATLAAYSLLVSWPCLNAIMLPSCHQIPSDSMPWRAGRVRTSGT